MEIKFCGAAQMVTGSQHLLSINGKKLLLDCGMFQGRRSEAYDMNREFLYEPAEIDALTLSHAHIDHSGNIPTLYKKGFRGDIYCTPATRDLCALMLLDSAHIQEKDIEYVNRKRAKKREPLFKPLYEIEDVKNVMKLFKTIPYHKEFNLYKFGDSVLARFFDAGHILGSAMLTMDIKENGSNIKFGFTGDLGRPNLPILRDPEKINDVDFLICESTYGCREHSKADQMEDQLISVLKEALSRNGKIIVPAFSVGRTQEFVYALSKLFSKQLIPAIPIYVDSPLSSNVSDIFRLHHECFDDETSKLLSSGVDVFSMPNLHYIRDVEDSKKLKDIKGSCIIISASGMAESGRILHHLANHASEPSATILIIGYMAEHTLGRMIIESKDIESAPIKIFGDIHLRRARVYVLNSFSAHADKSEIEDYMNKMDKTKLNSVFLVHGEPVQQECLKLSLESAGLKHVHNPARGETVSI